MTPTLIFAGTHAQAVEWRQANGVSRPDGEYIASERQLLGRSTADTPRVFVGTFWQRADATELQRRLLVCDLKTQDRS